MTESLLSSYFADSPLPPIDDAQRAEAQRSANANVFQVRYPDPAQPQGAPLGRNEIMGVREVAPDGTFTGEEWRNAEFVPHPKTAGTDITSGFELVLWRVAKGFAQGAQLIQGVVSGSFTASARATGELVLHSDEHGTTVHVFTTERRHPAGLEKAVTITGIDLIEVFGGDENARVVFNPATGTEFAIPAQVLAGLWREYRDMLENFAARQAPTSTTPQAMGTVAAPAISSGAQA